MTPATVYRWLLALCLATGFAQAVLAADDAFNEGAAAQERAAIEEARRVQTESLDARAKDCLQKFAITRCLNQVSSERLTMQRQLKQREEVLNDAQRHKRGLEQTERSREKAQAHAQKIESMASAPKTRTSLPKPPPRPGGTLSTRISSEPKSVLTDQQRIENARDYERKQTQALAKRAEVARRVLEKGAPRASLPAPSP